jgi:hypothetical protein
MNFDELVARRWEETAKAVGFDPAKVDLIWGVGGGYPHFKTARGFGVTFWDGQPPCRLLFASKLLDAPFHRQDGIVRHELGHVVDMVFPKQKINAWAKRKGITLASTDERRADDIALGIWGEPILYDRDLVQSTRYGDYPRPKFLGL